MAPVGYLFSWRYILLSVFTQKNRRKIHPSALWRSLAHLASHKKLAALAYSSLLISTAAQLMVPQLVQNIIDSVSNSYTAINIAAMPVNEQLQTLRAAGWTAKQFTQYLNGGTNVIFWAGVLILLFAIMRSFFAFSQSYNAEKISHEIAYDMRNELYARIQRLSFSYHDRSQTGQLMIRATDDVEKVRIFIGQGLMIAVQAIILLIGSLLILLLTNLQLTLVILPVLPLAVFIFLIFGRISQPLFNLVQIKLSAMNTILQENLAGIKVIKAFVQEPQQQKLFEQAAEDFMIKHITVVRLLSFLFPLIFLITNLGQAAVLYFGGRQIIDGSLTIGEWQKFSLYLVYVILPLSQLGLIISQMSMAGASARRVFEILDTKNEISSKANAVELPQLQGKVVFENVTFRYISDSQPALDEVSFTANPGETIALLGVSGSGKSTIINLIPRFYDVNQGMVSIDGYDVRDVCLDSLRQQIGVVLQETVLFSGSIRENIAFGKPNATMDEIQSAARAAYCQEFIMGFPEGYDTQVSERGTTLSGGQKQRIAIARALLMKPRILILDDSTSSVDVTTECHIQQSLERLMRGRTCFIIAQRISTVRKADHILVLENGRIAAQGKHEDLMEASPVYAEIYHSQLFDDSQIIYDQNKKNFENMETK